MFLLFLKLIGLTVLGELLRPKPAIQNAQPAGVNEFQVPTTEVGRPIGVSFGTVRNNAPALLWWGNYGTMAISSATKIKGLFKSKTVYQVVGYRYFISLHMGLGQAGIQSIHKIWSEEKIAWSGDLALPGNAAINKPSLYGGYDKGGGLIGTMRFQPGGALQNVDTYLASKLTEPPAFRGISGAIWQNGEIGTSPSLRPFSFEQRRIPSLLGLGAIDTADANPAEIAWETLTNRVWGGRADTSLLDLAQFTAVGEALEDEGFGLSILWDQRREIDAFLVDQVLRPIDGIIFPDFRSGKVTMKLIRDDYDPETVTVLHPGNAEIVSFTRSAWQGTTNDLRVLFTSRASGYKQDVAAAFDGANYEMQGGQRVSQQVQYPGIMDQDLAAEAAWRDVRATSVPMAQATIRTNRYAHRLAQGDVFVLRFPEYFPGQILMRIKTVKIGAPGGGGRAIELDCVQDVFSLASSAFAAPPPTEFVDTVADPEPVERQELGEAPYLLLAKDDGSAGAGTIDPSSARLLLVAARPNSSTTRADLETRISPSPYVARGSLEQMTPTALLVNDYPKETDEIDESETLIIDSLDVPALLVSTSRALVESKLRNLALIENADGTFEYVAWETIEDNGDGTYTLNGVWRGVLDTVPADHLAGARIWFSSEGTGTTDDSYAEGNAVNLRVVPQTANGTLDPDDATPLLHTITRRAYRPIPPGGVQVNGETWPETITGDLVVTWAHRDRLTQTTLVTQDESDIGPEAGTTYRLRIYGDGDVPLRTVTGITGTTHTYTEAEEISDGGGSLLQETLRIELESVRDGYASHQFHERMVLRGT